MAQRAVRRSVVSRNAFVIGSAALVCLLAVYAHIHVASKGDDYTGSLAFPDRIFDLLMAGGVAVAAFSAGRAIMRAMSLNFISVAEEISVSVLLGTGVIATAVLGLALAQLLSPIPVAALFVGIGAISYRELPVLWTAIVNGARSAVSTKPRQAATMLFLVLVFVLVVRSLTPPHMVDDAIYHLSVSERFVEEGRIFPVYDNFSGNMPFLLHMIYTVFLMAKADIATKLFSLSLAVITSLALYGFCARFLNRSTAVIAMLGFFGAGMVNEVGITARIDVSLAGMLIVSAYALMVHLETSQRGWLYVAAMLAGFSIGIKYTAGVWVLLLGFMYVVESVTRHRPISLVLKHGLVFTVIVVAIASPWFIKNQVWFQNPVYPFITGEVADYRGGQIRYFDSDDIARLNAHLDTARRDAPEAVRAIEKQLAETAAKRRERHPLRFWEYFTEPDTYNLGPAEANHDPNYLFVLVPLAFLFDRKRWLVWLGILSAAFYVFLVSTSWIARYLLPVYPALTILAAYSLTSVADRLRSRSRMAGFLPAISIAVVVGSLIFMSAVQIYVAEMFSFVGGALSRREFMSAAFYYPPIDFINHNVPPNERVMLIGAQMCYDLRRDYLAEGGWDSVEWERLLIRNSTLDEVNRDLKSQAVTHILFTPGLFEFVAEFGRRGSGPSGSLFRIGGPLEESPQPGVDYWVQARNWATFELFRSKYLQTVNTFDAGYTLYRLR